MSDEKMIWHLSEDIKIQLPNHKTLILNWPLDEYKGGNKKVKQHGYELDNLVHCI